MGEELSLVSFGGWYHIVVSIEKGNITKLGVGVGISIFLSFLFFSLSYFSFVMDKLMAFSRNMHYTKAVNPIQSSTLSHGSPAVSRLSSINHLG